MKRTYTASLAAAALLAACSGCTTSSLTARGQDPAARTTSDPAVTPASHSGAPDRWTHGYQPHPVEAMADHFQYTDVTRYKVQPNGQVVEQDWHHGLFSQPSHHAASCPASPNCPHCRGYPQGGQCPQCQNGYGTNGSHFGDYPQHHHTYGYMRPKNLRYPPPQVPGGAVVYPYYTHKGPSDFFRK